ncbi:MAG: substrate-binding domain-containing protein [Gallionellaceae bacterium]
MNTFKMLGMVFLTLCLPLSAGAAETKKIIAFAQDTMSNDFRKAQVNEVRDEAAKYPQLSFIYSDAQGQTSLLIRQIEQFIEQKVDLIILGTNDEKTVVPVVAKAYKSGIPVIVLDRGINGSNFTTFINSDNIKIGALGAEYIAQQLKGEGLVLLFEGLQKADVTQLRSKGFLDEIAKHNGIKVIKRTGNYLRKDAIVEMEKLVVDGIRVDAIFSESDSMLSGVRMVLGKNKIDPASIVMVGCDYTSEARDAIRAGTQSGSVLFPLGGKKSIEIALKIFAKKSVPKHIYNPVKLITRENVEQVMPIF